MTPSASITAARWAGRPAAGGQREQNRPRDEERGTPDRVHVDAERSGIDRLIAEQPVAHEQRSHRGEHQSDRQAHVESHQKNTRLSRNVASSGELTNANTSCRTSMMLLNCAATYAVSTDAAMPNTVAMRPTRR